MKPHCPREARDLYYSCTFLIMGRKGQHLALTGVLCCKWLDGGQSLQGYLAHKKTPSPRTLQQASAYGPTVVRGGGAFSHG